MPTDFIQQAEADLLAKYGCNNIDQVLAKQQEILKEA